MDYEKKLAQLEEIVKKLESGNLSLDESIAKYETALEYVKICNEMLENAEQRVKILTQGEDGTVSDRPFNQNEN